MTTIKPRIILDANLNEVNINDNRSAVIWVVDSVEPASIIPSLKAGNSGAAYSCQDCMSDCVKGGSDYEHCEAFCDLACAGNSSSTKTQIVNPPQYVRIKGGYLYSFIGFTSDNLFVYQIIFGAGRPRSKNKKTILPPN